MNFPGTTRKPPVATETDWPERNQAFLTAEFERLKTLLKGKEPRHADDREAGELSPPSAIDQLAQIYKLTSFERDIVLLCAGVEMDSALAKECRDVQGESQRSAPTFGLALATLPDPHWSALTDASPLRRFRLVDADRTRGITAAPLRIDERILHYLAGINRLDGRLLPVLVPTPPSETIAREHSEVAARIAPHLGGSRTLLVHLFGDDPDGQRDTAALAAVKADRMLFTLRAEEVPTDSAELEELLLLLHREVALLQVVPLLDCGTTALSSSVRTLLEHLAFPAVVSSRDPFPLRRAIVRCEVNKPLPVEQRRLWRQALGPKADELNGLLDNLAGQFRLSARAIETTATLYGSAGADALWSGCRSAAQPRLEELAQRLVPAAQWDDLVLPAPQREALRHIAAQARNRVKVYETWGFASLGRRGLGVSALFSGESGTGKTLAAEVLAHELHLDLYRIDLSAIVSKYIGETEKNLNQVFDAAEEAGAVLLFDEADALFGKRADVKDSRDRYANIEVGYLLQRMESYQGLAILTTNLKSSLDRAFHRRLRFIVEFPFPGPAEREAIWRRAIPSATPTDGINPTALAQLKLPGGSIRNIALNAAFLAAETAPAMTMEHILEAARSEALKNNRPLAEAETRGWV